MVREVCPRCHQVYSRDAFNTDYVHNCNSGVEALDNEDIPVVGTYEDTQGNTIVVHTKEQLLAGQENRLFGTKAEAEHDAKSQKVTARGNRVSTHATRKHFEYIDRSENGTG